MGTSTSSSGPSAGASLDPPWLDELAPAAGGGGSDGPVAAEAGVADNDAADAGATYVFVRRGTAWTQQAYIKASNAQGGDRFGFCATLSGDGNTLAVCGYDEDGSATGINGPENNDAGGSGAANQGADG